MIGKRKYEIQHKLADDEAVRWVQKLWQDEVISTGIGIMSTVDIQQPIVHKLPKLMLALVLGGFRDDMALATIL